MVGVLVGVIWGGLKLCIDYRAGALGARIIP
jgi:hypothetical protein